MVRAGSHHRVQLPAPMYHPVSIINPRQWPYYMEFTAAIGMHAGYLPGYPASHGCVRMPRDLAARFFERVNIRTPVTVDGSTQNLTSVRKSHPTVLKAYESNKSTLLGSGSRDEFSRCRSESPGRS